MNSIIKKFSHFACSEMKQKQMLIFLVGCIVTFILELLAYLFKGAFSIVASRLWMLSVIAFVIFFLFVVIKQLHEDIREKKLLLPFIFFVIICFFVFQIGNYGFSDMSYESTQEVLAGLRAFEQPDWNYTGKGFTLDNFGIIFGIVLGTVAVKLMGYEASVSLSSIVIAVGFSMAIGIFFGYYPANKAAKLNPIDALRYE